MDILSYFGKVNLYWIMLYACYWLMLRNHTFFMLNRFYLLSSLCVAFILPFIIYPETAPAIPVGYEITAASFTFSPAESAEQPLLTWTQMIWLIYTIGFSVAAYRLLYHILQLKKFLNAGERIELDDCKVVLIDSNRIGSFSFLKWIVINRNDYENHFDAIMRHETVHIQQWHSLDILFTEAMKVVFWFNPILHLYKRSFQEVHEFLADEQAPNREYYAKFLVAYALNAPVASLTNHFFKPSQIKSRIKMIYKNRTSKWLLSTYAISATLIGTVALLIAGCEQREDSALAESAKAANTVQRKILTGNKRIFTVVEQQPEFPGGMQAMYKFLGENLKYPESALKANVSGKVFLSFIVTDDGNIADVQILKGLGHGCDEEALRVLYQFPKWEPGRQNGKPVNVKYNLPINFRMDDDSKSSRSKSSGLVFNPDKNSPLIIVNGKITDAGEASKKLNANNIKSVSVLKNEQALKTYGKKAKNGVLEISTKDVAMLTGERIAEPQAKGFSGQPAIVISDNNIGHKNEDRKNQIAKYNSSSNTKVELRGNSLSGVDPLIVIDGVKQEKRGLKGYHLNSNEIKMINVLKNSSATAIYGEEGRNGVVIITTKK